MLKIGLVGVGGISGAHIPAWQETPEGYPQNAPEAEAPFPPAFASAPAVFPSSLLWEGALSGAASLHLHR
mgnify:CR=1 FL=1